MTTPKPAILCLHGSGSSAIIFNIQTIRIQRALPHFTFVFADAPFEVPAGPGILPTFEGCGPYYRWINETCHAEKPAETRELLERVCDEQKRKDGRGFVGVMGFSQGCRVAAGLLLEQQVGRKHVQGKGLKFGVLAMGSVPPLTVGLSELERRERIDLPTLHLIGLVDPYREGGRKLYAEHVNREQAVLLEFEVGHRLPTAEQDTAKTAAEILRMYRETSDQDVELGTAVI